MEDNGTISALAQKHASAAVTWDLWAQAMNDVVAAFERAKQRVQALDRRVAALEQRLADTERRMVKFWGVHEPGRTYSAGSAIVRSGSLWIARAATSATPGPDDAAREWQLAVKKGEAAR